MWSVFYMLVEFAQGGLPWRKLKDKVSLFLAITALPIEIRIHGAMHKSLCLMARTYSQLDKQDV